jgi:hypothetical protein
VVLLRVQDVQLAAKVLNVERRIAVRDVGIVESAVQADQIKGSVDRDPIWAPFSTDLFLLSDIARQHMEAMATKALANA